MRQKNHNTTKHNHTKTHKKKHKTNIKKHKNTKTYEDVCLFLIKNYNFIKYILQNIQQENAQQNTTNTIYHTGILKMYLVY